MSDGKVNHCIYLRGDISYKQGLEIQKPPIIYRANDMHGLYRPLIEAVGLSMYEVCSPQHAVYRPLSMYNTSVI